MDGGWGEWEGGTGRKGGRGNSVLHEINTQKLTLFMKFHSMYIYLICLLSIKVDT